MAPKGKGKGKRLPKSVYKRRQRNLILAMAGILLVLILSIVMAVQRRHREQPEPDGSAGTSASHTVTSTEPETHAPEETGTEPDSTGPVKGEIHMNQSEITLTVGETRRLQASDETEAAAKAEWSSSDSSIAAVSADGTITAVAAGSCTVTAALLSDSSVTGVVKITVLPAQTEAPKQTDAPAKTEAPVATPAPTEPVASQSPTYINGILIANKTYTLPSSYNPGVDPEAKAMFDKMQKAAAAEGLNIYIGSGFRSYDYQVKIYNSMVKAYGKEYADRVSARPGHSEHQTGLAFDLNSINQSFADTKESAWVNAHAHEYGFIIRYPKGKESITGYNYEPWHLRYLGLENAQKVYNSGLTLEEYLGITSRYGE